MISPKKYDVVLIGGGIMSATLGTLLRHLEPKLSIQVFERLDSVALESSNPWNNAGTGHAALCELNYMPDSTDGSLPSANRAIAINEQFQLSRQFWASLVSNGVLGKPETFISSTPHMTFVTGDKDTDYLARRYQALKDQPLFAGMEFATDGATIARWAPLLMEERQSKAPMAATRIESGTDVDFGSLTRQLFDHLQSAGVEIATKHEVRGLNKQPDGSWNVIVTGPKGSFVVNAGFVFVGAGGYALKLLQNAGLEEANGYGTFPVGGQWLRTDNPELVAKHRAKVYSQASVGAPPMSVPHLDTRVVDGKTSLLFGPYATSNPKFLKQGSIFDLPRSIRFGNLIPYLAVALNNVSLIKYLVGELAKSKQKKFESLLEFMPSAKPEDWELLNAGQRAQIVKRDKTKGGVLQFGTEIVTAADGSMSALLGASPGASTAVYAMIEVLRTAYGKKFPAWEPKLKELIPHYGVSLNSDAKLAEKVMSQTAKVLKLVK